MQKLLLSTFLILHLIISTHSEKENFLHVYNDNISENNRPIVIKNSNQELVEALHSRYRRDLPSDRNEGFKNITTKVSNNFLFDFFLILSVLYFIINFPMKNSPIHNLKDLIVFFF